MDDEEKHKILEELQELKDELTELRALNAWAIRQVRMLGKNVHLGAIGERSRYLVKPLVRDGKEGERIGKLADRERETLEMLSQGMKAIEIAEAQGVSKRTVENRICRMGEKLGCRGKSNMAIMFEIDRLRTSNTVEEILGREECNGRFGRKEIEWGISQFGKLKPREFEIVRLIANGWSYEDIGKEIDITMSAMAVETKNLRDKLDCQNREEVALLYLRKQALEELAAK